MVFGSRKQARGLATVVIHYWCWVDCDVPIEWLSVVFKLASDGPSKPMLGTFKFAIT